MPVRMLRERREPIGKPIGQFVTGLDISWSHQVLDRINGANAGDNNHRFDTNGAIIDTRFPRDRARGKRPLQGNRQQQFPGESILSFQAIPCRISETLQGWPRATTYGTPSGTL
jgi:hypothetical protein